MHTDQVLTLHGAWLGKDLESFSQPFLAYGGKGWAWGEGFGALRGEDEGSRVGSGVKIR